MGGNVPDDAIIFIMELFTTSFPYIVFSGFVPLALLFLRITLAIMFLDSGRRHLQDPTARAASLGLSKTLTIVIGLVEVIGGFLILIGLWTHYAAFFLSGVMVGAIYFKMFVWKTGIYGQRNDGWYYDALLLAGTGILFAIGAGELALDAWL